MSSVSETLKITHSSGLHARASTEFVRLAQRFSASVSVSRIGGSTVDGKSTIAVMTLGAQLGDDIMIRTTGPEAKQPLTAHPTLVRHALHGV